eukprot:7799648-Pyramimonas_sp.AAC.1
MKLGSRSADFRGQVEVGRWERAFKHWFGEDLSPWRLATLPRASTAMQPRLGWSSQSGWTAPMLHHCSWS